MSTAQIAPSSGPADSGDRNESAAANAQLLYQAASLYYLKDATQAEVAAEIGVSRSTVSRMLAEARRLGIVRIELVEPLSAPDGADLGAQVAEALDLQQVYVAPPWPSHRTPNLGRLLGPGVNRALSDVVLEPGDVFLVSSGRTVYEVAQLPLPLMPGVLVVPAIGGQSEAQPWYQTNEIVRQVASQVGGTPIFLYAPALPSVELHEVLLKDPVIQRIPQLWAQTKCALMGIGAPPLLRESIPRFVPLDAVSLRKSVGDVCSRFYDRNGEPIDFPGLDQLMAAKLELLPDVETSIAVGAGEDKVMSMVAGARGRYFNRLVTDTPTARALLDHLGG